ncbi:MAG: starch-binding protein [Lachnospiraceae bacterium]|nr:starch-binding protein [Lachnospiraceae bacterium]
MSKIMKKVSAFFALMLMMVSLIPTAVSATSVSGSDDIKVVYMQVPSDWENPCVWAWDDDGNNVFDAWPGGEAEADAANSGWYYLHIPNWANHVIVNANEGSVQTEEQILEDGNVWITVEAADSTSVSYDKLTEGDVPEYVEKFTVHACVDDSWNNPCIWAWSAPDGTNVFSTWPGEELEQDEDGWLVKRIPGWVNSIIVNGNEGSVQTSDISIDAGVDVWLVVTDAENYELYYEKPEIGETESGTEEVAAEETVEKSNTGLIVGGIVAVIAIVGIGASVVVAKKKK